MNYFFSRVFVARSNDRNDENKNVDYYATSNTTQCNYDFIFHQIPLRIQFQKNLFRFCFYFFSFFCIWLEMGKTSVKQTRDENAVYVQILLTSPVLRGDFVILYLGNNNKKKKKTLRVFKHGEPLHWQVYRSHIC